MNAEKGWIGEPRPGENGCTPGWLAEKGTGHSHFLSHRQTAKLQQLACGPALKPQETAWMTGTPWTVGEVRKSA